MDIISLLPQIDVQLIEPCLKCDCSIFGGYLRDIIAFIEPSDIDVLVPEINLFLLLSELKELGYTIEGEIDDFVPGIITCSHVTKREIELHSSMEEYPKFLYSDHSLDFDIDDLALCYRWHIAFLMDIYDNDGTDLLNTKDIMNNIQLKTATCMTTEHERIINIKNKSYTVI